MTYYSFLPNRAVLAVTGEDARDFLQGIISNDIRKVTSQNAIFAALLSPQGKFLFDFFIREHEGHLLLETEKNRLPELVKRLTMYRMRSKVTFEILEKWRVGAAWGGETAQDTTIRYADPRLQALGWRMLFPSGAGGVSEKQDLEETGDYDRHRLALGVPDGARDLIPDRSILLEYGYDELNGVDFAKGCYVGQEVTARSKHRAQLRKFIYIVQAAEPLPEKGTPVLVDNREIGILASSSGGLGLAHLRVEDVIRAGWEGRSLTAGGISLAARLPDWCRTGFAQEG